MTWHSMFAFYCTLCWKNYSAIMVNITFIENHLQRWRDDDGAMAQ